MESQTTTQSQSLLFRGSKSEEVTFTRFLRILWDPSSCPIPPKNNESNINAPWIEWLDQNRDQRKGSVLYEAFGSQAEVSSEQLREMATGLEESGVNFLWVVRKRKKDERGSEYYFPDDGDEEYMRRGAHSGVAHDGRSAFECENGGGGDQGGAQS
ncbi:UDP-glucuronosyl/UDP-glucosyltransferase [Parasponia andersonii]|uniref:UDP-glucuronosyl/UDP-glucosyltransferase n=1 Tax=Parasponia andersonii TaxID=3476 RepID=A0A2P5A9S0_PARAD|nr:UDP-glucuronosyl/UDP-glucosyltransferase [Parasponia andersonii]